MPLLAQFLIGLLFGSGLVISGMSNPEKVLNFLDLAAIPSGGWDPSLVLVMAGGVAVTYLGYKLVLKRERPLFDAQFHLSNATNIDTPIIVGPAIFGIGWGLVGFCPGPAFTAIGTGSASANLFVAAMIAGMVAARLLALRQQRIAVPEEAK
jgi:uncharacterized membrane protein YedE/YeeE